MNLHPEWKCSNSQYFSVQLIRLFNYRCPGRSALLFIFINLFYWSKVFENISYIQAISTVGLVLSLSNASYVLYTKLIRFSFVQKFLKSKAEPCISKISSLCSSKYTNNEISAAITLLYSSSDTLDQISISYCKLKKFSFILSRVTAGMFFASIYFLDSYIGLKALLYILVVSAFIFSAFCYFGGSSYFSTIQDFIDVCFESIVALVDKGFSYYKSILPEEDVDHRFESALVTELRQLDEDNDEYSTDNSLLPSESQLKALDILTDDDLDSLLPCSAIPSVCSTDSEMNDFVLPKRSSSPLVHKQTIESNELFDNFEDFSEEDAAINNSQQSKSSLLAAVSQVARSSVATLLNLLPQNSNHNQLPDTVPVQNSSDDEYDMLTDTNSLNFPSHDQASRYQLSYRPR